ncbi:MAG TPA: hypothetical protein DCL44_02590 [Elusimicrobia bacterium]|nr:hypothetical protein [Elusimicrobiota bacterium]
MFFKTRRQGWFKVVSVVLVSVQRLVPALGSPSRLPPIRAVRFRGPGSRPATGGFAPGWVFRPFGA